MDISVELHCDRCGSANLNLPEAGDEASAITCNDCSSSQGTMAELTQELLACVRAHSAQQLRADLDLPS